MRVPTMMMTVAALASGGAARADERLYACGDDQVREYRVTGDAAVETWRWTAAAAGDLPVEYRAGLLTKIDECKPVENGRAILVTASTGGVVLIDRASGRTRFRATAPMAHSADLLPGGHVAVALSVHGKGDRLELYRLNRNEQPLASLPLPSGHGVVWDARRRRLYALSHDLIQAFAVKAAARAPRLTETARWTLPGRRDGHDLSRRDDGSYLVTTDDGVWTFDPGTGRFAPFAALNPKLRVKAISAMGARLAWVQAEENWWAKGFTIARADGADPVRTTVDPMHLYKVRWIR